MLAVLITFFERWLGDGDITANHVFREDALSRMVHMFFRGDATLLKIHIFICNYVDIFLTKKYY